MTEQEAIEQEAIEQLNNYKRMKARLHVLSNYSVGAGITVSRLNEDDHLQELHRKLRGLPTYMYLSKKEQQLETVAHAYLGGKYPAGIKSQHRAIATVGVDEEDTKTLQDLKFKIARVLAARGYDERNDIDKVLDIIAEMQDIQIELKRIDNVLAALEQYKPDFAKLLKYKYIDGYSSTTAAVALNITERTFVRWHKRAIAEYLELAANCL